MPLQARTELNTEQQQPPEGGPNTLLGSVAGKIHHRHPPDLLHRAPGLGGKFEHLLPVKDMSDPHLA